MSIAIRHNDYKLYNIRHDKLVDADAVSDNMYMLIDNKLILLDIDRVDFLGVNQFSNDGHLQYNLVRRNNIFIRHGIYTLESATGYITTGIYIDGQEHGIRKRYHKYALDIEIYNYSKLVDTIISD